MSKRGMSTGVEASSTRGVVASPSTSRDGTSQVGVELRTKHRNNVVNVKLLPTILPYYIPPLSGEINKDTVPKDFEYTLVTAYLLKGVHTYCENQDKVTALKFYNFKLVGRKAYSMLAPSKYLTRTKG
jgi:hypothetical protein